MSRRGAAALFAAGLILASCGGSEPAGAATVTSPSSTAGTTTTTTDAPATTAAQLTDDAGRVVAVTTGASLPRLPADGPDPAIGMTIPTVEGAAVDGASMAIGPSAETQAIVFLAHWCPHCREEVVIYSDWLRAYDLPEGTRLVAVATGIDSLRQNYPPEDWLEDAGWPVATLIDPTNEVANAFGLTAFPFWVFVDADGQVVARGAGTIDPETLSRALLEVAAG